MAEKRTLLIPSLLDDWFPLLRYAFSSEAWDPVLLGGDWREAEAAGLRSGEVITAVDGVSLAGDARFEAQGTTFLSSVYVKL